MVFTTNEQKALGLYVYRLIDPRNGETFYVGRGRDNRIFQHVKEAEKIEENKLSENFRETDDTIGSLKLHKINSIKKDGLEVAYVIHRHKIPHEAIDHVEAAVIDAFPGLTNEKRGYRSADTGPMTVRQIRKKYGLEELTINAGETLLLININALEDTYSETKIIKQIECAWRLDPKRAEKAQFVLAVHRGVIIGAFGNSSWETATRARFPQLSTDEPDRYGFEPKKLNDHLLEHFCGKADENGSRPGKLVPKSLSGSQNPIRYSF